MSLQQTNRTRAEPAGGHARQRLRKATADLHARVDGLFGDGLDRLARYDAYLLGMHRFAADYEAAVALPPKLSAWLALDLLARSLAPLPPLGIRPPLASPWTRLGWDYVMAGSSLGARRLLRDARGLGLDADRGAYFLSRHAEGTDWAAVQARLAAIDPGDARMAETEAGARDAFALVEACFLRAHAMLPVPDHEATA